MHRLVCRALVALVVGSCSWIASPAGPAEAGSPEEATTSREARNDAIRAIPFQRIAPNQRQHIRNILDDTSVYRRLPTVTIDCYPPLFTYMAQNPDVLVQIWRQLGISTVDLVRLDETSFRMSDSVGTVGRLTIVDQQCDDHAQNRMVMIADGSYEGKPFQTPVHADCVLLLRSGSVKETNGRRYVAARLDTFLRINRASLEIFAKAVHPLVGRMADRNFTDTMHFVSNMSQASATRPATIERLTNSLPNVAADRKSRLVSIAYACGEAQPATTMRVARASGEEAPAR